MHLLITLLNIAARSFGFVDSLHVADITLVKKTVSTAKSLRMTKSILFIILAVD